jgi:hypothetical protein
VAPVLFLTLRAPVAAFVTLLGASMWLPNGLEIKIRPLPDIQKEDLASLLCLICALVYCRPQLRRARVLRGPEALMLVVALATFGSLLTNLSAIHAGQVTVPGSTLASTVRRILNDVIQLGVPFFIGRALVVRSRDLRGVLTALVLAGLVYAPLIIIELWLSPQMHRWTYGYHQHAFAQTLRGDGYRPMVYMYHGLNLTLLVFMCMAAAFVSSRAGHRPLRLPPFPIGAFLGGLLVACKSTGSTLYGLVTAPLVLFTPPRLQMLAAVMMGVVVCAYPVARASELVPVEDIIEVAREYAGDKRAGSLAGRLRTESEMIGRVRDRLWFGWASAQRAALRDPITGEITTTYDGLWLILSARGGFLYMGAIFLMLVWPLFSAARRLKFVRSRSERVLIAGLALMVGANLIDDLPNATVEGYLTFLSGALSGVVPGILRRQRLLDRRRREQLAEEARARAQAEAQQADTDEAAAAGA